MKKCLIENYGKINSNSIAVLLKAHKYQLNWDLLVNMNIILNMHS